MRCSANLSDGSGEQCDLSAVRGATVCHKHGAAKGTPARKRAAIRAEVSAWGVDDEHVEPGEQLLRLLAQSSRRAALYGMLLEQEFTRAEQAETSPLDESDREGGMRALIGDTLSAAQGVGIYATGEAVRALVRLEAEERDRCARFAKLALDAGIAERLVRLQEDQAGQVVAMIRRTLVAVGVDPNDERVDRAVRAELVLLAGTA